jgi:hypothetical protein
MVDVGIGEGLSLKLAMIHFLAYQTNLLQLNINNVSL